MGSEASTSGQHIPRGEPVELVDVVADPPKFALQVSFPTEQLHIALIPLDPW